MGYKSFASMNIAIIGNGRMSAVLAQGLALAGHEIMIGIKEEETIMFDFLLNEFDNIQVMDVESAAHLADLIIMATAPEQVREMAYLLDDVRKKVILDITSAHNSRFSSYFNTLSTIKAITGSPYVVKCFNTRGFEPGKRVAGKDNTINMFIAGDDVKAKATAKVIARDLGFAESHDFGGIDAVPLLDEMALCYHNLAVRETKGEKIMINITKR